MFLNILPSKLTAKYIPNISFLTGLEVDEISLTKFHQSDRETDKYAR